MTTIIDNFIGLCIILESMLKLQKYSYHFGEELLNTKLHTKLELDSILTGSTDDISQLSRPKFNEIFKNSFLSYGWKNDVSNDDNGPQIEAYFIKNRIGVNLRSGHSLNIGADLLKFEIDAISNKIDLGVYVVTTKNFQKKLKEHYNLKWSDGSVEYERVLRHLPYYKKVIRVPICVIGIDI